jgi:acetyltransferase-like isoleucine patch superfamily enzyme
MSILKTPDNNALYLAYSLNLVVTGVVGSAGAALLAPMTRMTHPYQIDGHPNIGYRILDDGREVSVGDGCFIGYRAVLMPGVHLAAGCIVGVNCVVTQSFGPRSAIAGVPPGC